MLSTTLGHLHDGTNGREHGDQDLLLRNPADTFSITIRTSAITAARDLTIPLLTGNRTLVANDTPMADSDNLLLGTGGDATIDYDGTDLVIRPSVVGTGHVIIDSQANDGIILSGESSDVGHALVSGGALSVKTTEFLAIGKRNATEGGVTIYAIAEDGGSEAVSLNIVADGGTPNTDDTSSSFGLIAIQAREHDGANALANAGDTVNILSIGTQRGGASATHFLVKGNGDIHVANTTLVALDDYPDALLMRAGRAAMAPKGSALREEHQDLIKQFAHVLEDRRIMFFERDETGEITGAMNNVAASIMLAWDGLFQHEQRLRALEGRIG